MDTKRFPLGPGETSLAIRTVRIIFGITCLGLAVFWALFRLRIPNAGNILWVAVAFLAGFGAYQVWAGLGKADRFIEISDNRIILRKNSLLPSRELAPSALGKIEIHPMSISFRLTSGRSDTLRFGTVYSDKIEPVVAALEEFSTLNRVQFEEISDML
jgi:hypothetical protein